MSEDPIDMMVDQFVESARRQIREQMALQGLSQRELARMIGTTDSRISILLNSENNNCTIKTLIQIGASLGMAWKIELM